MRDIFKPSKDFKHRQKVTTINLEAWQIEVLKTKNVNTSMLLRELLSEFLKREWPELCEAVLNENEGSLE